MQHVLFQRFFKIGLLAVCYVIVSSSIYYWIGGGDWSLFNCFYMVIITMTTVGYGEVTDFTNHPEGRYFTVFVALFGYLIFILFVSLVAELLASGEMKKYLKNRKVKKMISYFQNHFIVCGFGEMGFNVARELHATYHPVVIVDSREDIFSIVAEKISPEIPIIKGDASHEHILKQAGIDKARGIVLTLSDDKDNMFALVTARSMNATTIVASQCMDEANAVKFTKAGANKVIMPANIAGMRLASELIRPTVTNFLDIMLRDKDKNLRVEEVALADQMDCVDKTLQESNFRNKTNVLIMAVSTGNGEFIYNPPADLVLRKEYKLIVLGQAVDIAKFKKLI